MRRVLVVGAILAVAAIAYLGSRKPDQEHAAGDAAPPEMSMTAGEAPPAAPHARRSVVVSVPVPSGAPASGPRIVPGRLLASASQIPPDGVGGYGIVAMRSRPTAANQTRLQAMCRSFLAHFESNENFPESIAMAERMLTIWPYQGPQPDVSQSQDCGYLTDHYDLVSGIAAIEDAAFQGVTLEGQGPFLIGWSPSASRRTKDKIVLILDLSRMDSPASFDEAFAFWQRKIVEDPSLWRSGWSATGLKLVLRDYIDRNAPSLLSAIKFTGMGN